MNQRPEFHLRRLPIEQRQGPLELYSCPEVVERDRDSRRNFLSTGISMGVLVGALGRGITAEGAAKEQDEETIHAHTHPVKDLVFTPNGRQLLSCSSDKTIKQWNVRNGSLVRTIDEHTLPVHALSVSPKGDFFASASSDHTIRMWSLPSGGLINTFTTKSFLRDLAIHPRGRFLASCSLDKSVELWSLPDGERLQSLDNERDRLYSMTIAPQGDRIAAAGATGIVRVWSSPGGRLVGAMGGHISPIAALSYSADGKYLVTGDNAGSIKVWEGGDDAQQFELEGEKQRVTAVASVPNSKQMVSCGPDNSIILWSLPDGTVKRSFSGHTDTIRSLAVSPDGDLLASGDDSGAILLWSLNTGECLGYLFDPKASEEDGFIFTVQEENTGRVLTYTVPCGTPLPAGATCVCDCVPGTYVPPVIASKKTKRKPRPVAARPRTRNNGRVPFYFPPFRGPSYYPTGSSLYCSCNKICICIPVCQAHRLLHQNRVVRSLSENLLLLMGRQEFPYMQWAATNATPSLKRKILEIMDRIRSGETFAPELCPSFNQCLQGLEHPDEVVAIMSAQMISRRWNHRPLTLSQHNRVQSLLTSAISAPWFVRYGVSQT